MADVIRIGDLRLEGRERAALQRVIDSGRVSEGREVRDFEDEFAEWLGVKYVVATSSGTTALQCGFMATKAIFPRINSVLLPALTFVATANAVKLAGLEPWFADISATDYCIDPSTISPGIAYDVIMPVHLFGFVANMDAIEGRRWGASILVEDACEAHGSTYKGKKAGTFGWWSAFSFYIAHTVQAGELGVVATNDKEVATVVRQVKAHGRMCPCRICTRNTTGCPLMKDGEDDPRFKAAYIGTNAKANEFSAAIARVQLEKVDYNIQKRKRIARLLRFLLEPLEDLVILPPFQRNHVPMVYPIMLREDNARARNRIISDLAQSGIESRPMFSCIPTQQPSFEEYRQGGSWPVAERIGRTGFYVGCHQYIDEEKVYGMAETIVEVVERNAK